MDDLAGLAALMVDSGVDATAVTTTVNLEAVADWNVAELSLRYLA
jgi:hypothetical protein